MLKRNSFVKVRFLLALLVFWQSFALAAPIVITPGSTSSYLYVPHRKPQVTINNTPGDSGSIPPADEPLRVAVYCHARIHSGNLHFISRANAIVYYTVTGGGGGGGAVYRDYSNNRYFNGGGGGGSSAILVNGELVLDSISNQLAVGRGGDGGLGGKRGQNGHSVSGSFSIKRGDEIQLFIGGGGAGAPTGAGASGGWGYFGGGGGASSTSETNLQSAKGGRITGGQGGQGDRKGEDGVYGSGGRGIARSANSYVKFESGGYYGGGGAGGRGVQFGGSESMNGSSSGKDDDGAPLSGSGGKGSSEGSQGAGGGAVSASVGAGSAFTSGVGGDAGSIELSYRSDSCWIPVW